MNEEFFNKIARLCKNDLEQSKKNHDLATPVSRLQPNRIIKGWVIPESTRALKIIFGGKMGKNKCKHPRENV